jgi:predicted phosphodiesterase
MCAFSCKAVFFVWGNKDYSCHDQLFSIILLTMMFSREYGKKKNVSYAYIRLFGCRAFLYFYKDERSKLDNKIKQYFFY